MTCVISANVCYSVLVMSILRLVSILQLGALANEDITCKWSYQVSPTNQERGANLRPQGMV